MIGNESEKIILPKEMQMANKQIKRCSTSLAFKRNKPIKTTRHHCILTRIAIIRRKPTPNVCEDVEKLELADTLVGM